MSIWADMNGKEQHDVITSTVDERAALPRALSIYCRSADECGSYISFPKITHIYRIAKKEGKLHHRVNRKCM